jgi:hypothetical protein
LSVTALALITWSGNKVDISFIVEDAALFGVIGTLLGAFIGGTFSLIGSVWINNRQQRAIQNVKRKNVIYSPLYDELVDIQNNILEQNPYPRYIAFQKDAQTIVPHPQYDAWRRIKLDTRYLEVPKCLKIQIEKLENSIRQYINIRHKADDEVQKILNAVLAENGMKPCRISNIGSVISSDILKNQGIDIYKEAMFIEGDAEIDTERKEVINHEIWVHCNNNSIVKEVRLCYDNWRKEQGQTIEMLSIMIKRVLLKYEE